MWKNPVVGYPISALRFRRQENLLVPISPGCGPRSSSPPIDSNPPASHIQPPVSPTYSNATIPISRRDHATASASTRDPADSAALLADLYDTFGFQQESSEDLYSPQEKSSPAPVDTALDTPSHPVYTPLDVTGQSPQPPTCLHWMSPN